MNTRSVIHESLQTAVKSGITGYGAISLQVVSLMWLRTTVNYQYKHGTNFRQTLGILYNQGKIPRFYRGIIPAFFQAPLSRFGDVATNNPRRLQSTALVRDARQLVTEHRVDEIPIVDEEHKPIGLIDVQDLIALKVVSE